MRHGEPLTHCYGYNFRGDGPVGPSAENRPVGVCAGGDPHTVKLPSQGFSPAALGETNEKNRGSNSRNVVGCLLRLQEFGLARGVQDEGTRPLATSCRHCRCAVYRVSGDASRGRAGTLVRRQTNDGGAMSQGTESEHSLTFIRSCTQSTMRGGNLVFLAAIAMLAVLSGCGGSFGGDESHKINGSIDVPAGKPPGAFATVNGSIHVDDDAAVTSAST